MSKIIGIMGYAGSGKDTVADYLVKHHNFLKMSLAGEMKDFCKKIFGFSSQQLWGPSQYRNEIDRSYDDPDRWDLAEDNIYTHGKKWCEKLFGEARVEQTYHALLNWFDNLRIEYGSDFGWSKNKVSPRIVLQTIGTEFGRTQDPNVWVRTTTNDAKTVLAATNSFTDGFSGVVISDCRFKNEVEGVHAAGGIVVRVKRPAVEKPIVLGVVGHTSESEQDKIPDSAVDHVIISPEGLDNLREYLDQNMYLIVNSLS